MNVGTFKNVKGQLLGMIATRDIDLPQLGLKSVSSNNVRAPRYEVVALNPGKRWVQIGALWEATSNNSGEVFLQGKIDDPSFSEEMQIALFGTDEEGYRVVWNRPKPQRTTINGDKAKKRGPADFGDGNATDDGQLASRDDSEMVPF